MLTGISLAVYAIQPLRYHVRGGLTTVSARLSAPAEQPFPAINLNGLSETQLSIINLARAEYAKRPVSYDSAVLEYTQGNNEAWCADFASWVMREAGIPFKNPHSGSWRIPGVYTLQEYFESQDHFVIAGTYTPETGDIAFLHGPGGHVAIVLGMEEGKMLTIGGNENGRMRVSTRSIIPGEEGLIGFGTLLVK